MAKLEYLMEKPNKFLPKIPPKIQIFLGWGMGVDVFVPVLSPCPQIPSHPIKNHSNNLIFPPFNERFVWEMGLKFEFLAVFSPCSAVPPSGDVCINTFLGLYTQIWGCFLFFFIVQVIKDGGRFLCFLNRWRNLRRPEIATYWIK